MHSRYGGRGSKEDGRTCRSKGITTGELPHSRHKLSKTTSEAGHAEDDIGCVDVSCVYIVHGKNECGGCEREQTTSVP